tara:strand:- start:1765 stop:3873 length:2109 start_codon:yes stop_codon:yes gene_type:complete
MRIKLNESEKNRIKSLHKNYSIIKEQDNCPPSDTTSPFYTNPGEFCINCGPGAYYFNHNDCPCCDGDNQVGMEPCKDPNSPFNTNLPEFCYVQNGVYHHQQPGASYHNHPDADCCGPIVDDDGDVLDLDDESYENEVGVSMIGSGSGFKDKQGNSDRLEKFNRNNIDLKAKPSSGGNFRMGESDLRRIVNKVINEQNYYPSANPWNVNPLQQCQNCMWFVNNAAQQGLNWSFADCQTPCGSPTTALYDGQLDCQMCKMWFPQNLWSTKCSTLCSSAWYNMWEINPCFRCNNNPKSPTFNQPNPNLNLPANVVEVLNYSSWGKSQGPCPSGAEKDWPDLNMGKGCEIQKKIDKVDFDTPKGVTEPVKPLGVDKVHDGPRDYEPSNNDMMESDLRRQTRHKGKSKVIVNLTETELISYINKSIINEQQNPCIDPSTIDPQYQPLGVACLCSLNVGWSNGNQYGGTIELDGCMPPNGSVFRIYVNDNFAAQGSSLSFSTNISWQGQQTSIIKVKTVLECTGQHPACSEETIEKSICVERSTGNKVSCGKRLPDNPLKGDKTKSVYNPDGGSQLDIDSLNKKGSMTNYKPSQSSHSSYGKETTNLRESDLIRLIRRAVNEQQATSWNCEDGKCVKVVGKGGVGDFATLQECEDSNCEERARPTGTGVRKHDRDMAKRRPYSPKYRDMRGSRNESVRRQKLIDTSKF